MIVVIGSINMDLVLRVPRMPLPGETLTGGAFRTIPGGKGANQAVACARLSGKLEAGGQQVAMIGCVGDDAFGATLRAALRSDGIIDSHISTLPGVASGIASILVDDNGQNSIVIAGGANDLLSPAHIDAAQDLIAQADIVVLQLETPIATVEHAIKLARSLGKTVVLNPAPATQVPAGLLELVDYLIPNEIEAAMLTGVDSSDASVLARALQKQGSDNVIITLGAKGVHAALYGGDVDFPAEAVKAVDTTAAGDTFIGGFVAGLASGMDEAEAIAQGQRAAAWSVTKPGAQTSIPHLHELF
ncbi:MAG: ribokinase [Pseudomonadota bacterium]|jgi:ribokinase